MAALQVRNEAWRVIFRYRGQQHALAIGKVSESEAHQWKTRTEQLLMRIKQRLLDVPQGMPITTFIEFDGKPPADLKTEGPKDTTFGQLRDQYVKTFSNGAIEANTLYTAKIHLNHLETTLGKHFLLSNLTLAGLQKHIDRRLTSVASVTIRKEINSFRAAWNWGSRMTLVEGGFPSHGLVYPKGEEKLPFMTWAEIERRINAGGDADELWEALYLDTKQITELLKHVKASKSLPAWFYPMLLMAAHTGARRSELIRARLEDVDQVSGVVTIREKKKARGTLTTRRIPLSKLLSAALRPLMKSDRIYLFSNGNEPLGVDAAHQLFERAMNGSKWAKVRGYHVFRHSFISALACAGVDQRVIDEFAGHSTEQQRKRYRHLLPGITQKAISLTFG